MLRKILIILAFAGLFSSGTLYFGSQCAAELLRQRGERAFLRNDLVASFESYERAQAAGGDPERLAVDVVEVLLFGLDQAEAGIAINLPLTVDESVGVAGRLVADLITTYPYKAYYWSLASDIYFHGASSRRRSMAINLSTISEDELDNLLVEDWLGFAALLIASRLEPNNYIYHDLLTELYLDKGSVERASIHAENAVLALPELDSHRYLIRRDLPASMLEAAVRGFEEASGRRSLIGPARIECDAGRLMAKHGRDREAIRYFERALDLVPTLYDAEAESGYAYYRLDEYREAIEHFRRATAILPRQVWPHFLMGQAHRALGEYEEAIAAFRRARELKPRELRFFHALGEILEGLGRSEEAERQFRAAANVNVTRSDAWSKLLAFYVRQGERRKAMSICERMQKENIGNTRYMSECAILTESAR